MHFIFTGVTPTSPKAARKPMFTEMPSSQPERTSSQPLSQQFLGKLSQLENLQYELTKQVNFEIFIHEYPVNH